MQYVMGAGCPVDIRLAQTRELARRLKMNKCKVRRESQKCEFFPAEQYGGIATIKALAAPYAMLSFMPTGGINAKNLKDYLEYEKILCCGGSWMVKGDLIKNKEFDKIRELTKEAVELVGKYRTGIFSE